MEKTKIIPIPSKPGHICVTGYSILEVLAAWTRTTNVSGTDGGLFTSELQAGADLSLGSSVASDCDGTLPRCVLLVCTGQEFDNLEGIAHPCDGVGLGGNCGAEMAMVWLKLTRVCGTTALPSKLTILLSRAHQSAVLPPSHQQVQVTIATVSLCRKKALLLAQRATRSSRVQL